MLEPAFGDNRRREAARQTMAARLGLEPDMSRLLLCYASDEDGASAIEYGLIVSLIAVAILGVLATLGLNLRDKAGAIADAVATAGN